MKKHLFGIFFFLIAFQLPAQELNCKVTIDSKRLTTQQVSEKAIFDDMQKAINNFMNNTDWTTDDFRPEERIDCDLLITLTQAPSQNQFSATAQIRAVRPVYNTTLKSTLISYNDREVNFRYVQGNPLIFNKNNFSDNLTSMLAFYAYTILALDYDSFSKGGGNPYVETVFNIVNTAQSSGENGWRQGTTVQSRYWISENLISQQMLPFREAFYKYHRLGLDKYLASPSEARQQILEALEDISKVNKIKPAAALTNIFFDVKGNEIVNIFKDASPEIRKQVRDMLVLLDPNKAQLYDKLTN